MHGILVILIALSCHKQLWYACMQSNRYDPLSQGPITRSIMICERHLALGMSIGASTPGVYLDQCLALGTVEGQAFEFYQVSDIVGLSL